MASETLVNSYTIVEHVSSPAPFMYDLLTAICEDLAGWQLDQLAENPKQQAGDVSDSDSDEDVPFACLICRKHFTDPIVTKCGHFFCSVCAIKRFAKTPKCLACGAPTGGMFNRAGRIIEKMNKKKKKGSGEGDDDAGDTGGGDIEIEGLDGSTSD